MHENALFRESKSQHDIRSLKAQICEGKCVYSACTSAKIIFRLIKNNNIYFQYIGRSRRQLGDLDCHVVGGVLVSALKDMPNALLFEIQENLQEVAGELIIDVCDLTVHVVLFLRYSCQTHCVPTHVSSLLSSVYWLVRPD
jgi:hypothetical protein